MLDTEPHLPSFLRSRCSVGSHLQPGCISSYNCLPSLPPSSLLQDLTQCYVSEKQVDCPLPGEAQCLRQSPLPSLPGQSSFPCRMFFSKPHQNCTAKNRVLTTRATQILEGYPKGSSPSFPLLSPDTWVSWPDTPLSDDLLLMLLTLPLSFFILIYQC